VLLRGKISNISQLQEKKVLALDKISATVILAECPHRPSLGQFADKAVDEES